MSPLLAGLLRAERQRQGVTLSALGARCKPPRAAPTLAKIESGRSAVRDDTAEAVAQALGYRDLRAFLLAALKNSEKTSGF